VTTASTRRTITVPFLILAVDLLFVYMATFGLYGVPGQIGFFFFGPAMIIGDKLAFVLHVPNGINPLVDIFVIQFVLLATVAFGAMALRKWIR
jgi:hypothetical protein